MAAYNFVVLILLRLFRLPPNAQSANVVFATVRNENMIEISEANWTIVFVNLPHLSILFAVTSWVVSNAFDLALLVICRYPDFVPLF